MQIPDFEALFADYVRELSLSDEEIEERLDTLYTAWEQQPLEALGGLAPAAYFERMNGKQALAYLLEYHAQRIAPPPELLNRLHDTHAEIEPELSLLLRREDAPIALREFLLELLLHGEAPALEYCREGLLYAPEHPLANSWHHALKQAGEAEWALQAYPEASREARKRLLDIFVDDFPDEAYTHALDLFLSEEEDLPYAANLLARSAQPFDEEALDALQSRLREEIDYIAYHEICHAIEALGGILPELDRDFSEDSDYMRIAEGNKDES